MWQDNGYGGLAEAEVLVLASSDKYYILCSVTTSTHKENHFSDHGGALQ